MELVIRDDGFLSIAVIFRKINALFLDALPTFQYGKEIPRIQHTDDRFSRHIGWRGQVHHLQRRPVDLLDFQLFIEQDKAIR